MYKSEFDKLKEYPNYLLFFGDEFFLKLYEEKITEKYKNDNILKIYFDEYDYEIAKKHLIEPSLFGGENVLIIKHSKIPPNIEKLIEYSKNGKLFFFYYGNKKIDKFKKNFVRFFAPNLREVIEIINFYADKYSLTLSQSAKNYLATHVNPAAIEKELEKLSNYSQDITLEILKSLVFDYKEESFEELIAKMLEGKDFFEDLRFFLDKNDYRRIIPAIIRYVRDLYSYNLYIKKTGANTLEGFLGYKLPFQIEKRRVNLALKFKEKDYKELLTYLLRKELEMRNSDKNKEAVFWESIAYLKMFKSF